MPAHRCIKWCLLISLFIMVFPPTKAAAGEKSRAGMLATGNAAFALDLYSTFVDMEGNIVMSPYSISAALAMTYAGARGNTAAQMERTLHFPLQGGELHAGFAALEKRLREIQEEGCVTLHSANSLWPQQGYPFLEEFLSSTRDHYGSTVTPVDFLRAPDLAAEVINAWIEERTAGRIPDLIRSGDIDPVTVLVLVNAIYFKGNWQHPFGGKNTHDAEFKTPDGAMKDVRMMCARGDFRLGEYESAQVLELPYESGDLSFCVILPREERSLSEIEQTLTTELLGSWIRGTSKKELLVYLPRFTAEWGTVDISSNLISLGMTDAFKRLVADFSGMDGSRNLFIGVVFHKAFIEVNEEGTEAAAATAVLMKRGGPVFRANRPFLFLIRERATGSILFMGRIVDPSA